jgi:hypothetical protein
MLLVTVVVLVMVALLVIVVVGILRMLAVAIIIAALVRMARHIGWKSWAQGVNDPSGYFFLDKQVQGVMFHLLYNSPMNNALLNIM